MRQQRLTIKKIPFEQIDFNDKTYHLRPESDSDDAAVNDLASSIKFCGILHPPLVLVKEDKNHTIIAGRRRLSIYRHHAAARSCHCLVVPAAATPMDCWHLFFEEGLQGPTWSLIIKSRFLKKIMTTEGGREEDALRFMGRLDLPANPHHLKKIIALTELEAPLISAAQQGTISEKTALAMTAMSFRDRLAVFELISSLRLSVSNQRRLIQTCLELCRRESTSIHTVLSSRKIMNILDEQDVSLPRQTVCLMEHLQNRQFPRLSAAQEEFEAWQDRLQLPKWASVSHTPAFEKDQVCLNLDFSSRDRLTEFLRHFPEF
ncbi:ParB/RepB/Spo0J family partition protein [Desulfobacterota bacterium M19]